jgi:hypothetical protein
LTETRFNEILEMTRIGNLAVHKAQVENRQLGIPNVYALHGRLFFELPDGTITQKNPFEEKGGDVFSTVSTAKRDTK